MAQVDASRVTSNQLQAINPGRVLERRGRAWLLWSFLLCPCHLPLTLAALTGVLAGTSVGMMLRDYLCVAGTLITVAWVAGTGYGFRLIRQAERAGGACSTRDQRAARLRSAAREQVSGVTPGGQLRSS